MESEPRTVTPSKDAHVGNLVPDSPLDDAVCQGPSDAEFNFPSPSPSPSPPSAPPHPELEANSMSRESSTPTSDVIRDSHQDTPLSEPSQSEELTSVLGGSYPSHSTPPPVTSVVPPNLTSEGEDASDSKQESEALPTTSSTPCVLETCPLLIPLPESDVEEEGLSEFASVERATSTVDSGHQDRGASTTRIDERTDTDRSDVHDIASPSEMDYHQALWELGDTVLERRDRRVHERWKAGLGVTFVLANMLSVLILCIALELYRRTKAAHPGLIAKIRARHVSRVGRKSPFSPIVSLFFEKDAPFVHSNTAFLAGLCTTLACTLLSDIALRWVARNENRVPPPGATPRDRMVARMEWNERIERRAVPWLFEIGIPGLLYVSLGLFYTGAIMRILPRLNMTICAVAGAILMSFSIFALWSYEPALDARSRPKPVSSSTRR